MYDTLEQRFFALTDKDVIDAFEKVLREKMNRVKNNPRDDQAIFSLNISLTTFNRHMDQIDTVAEQMNRIG